MSRKERTESDHTAPVQSQGDRFIEAARELGTDEDPEHFKAIVKRLAKAPIARNADKPALGKRSRRND